MAIKTFINGQENGVITYLGDTEPCAVYVNGERQDNISYKPTPAEGADSVSYKSEYKNNLRTLQIEGDTEQEGGLPSAYQQVEYIESTGTQYIDTGIKGSSNIKMYLEGAFERISGYVSVTGSRNAHVSSPNANAMCFFANAGNEDYQYYLTSYKTTDNSANKISVEMSKDGIFLNGVLKHQVSQDDWSNNHNITIFAVNTAGSIGYGKNHKIYCYRLYDNGVLVRDFVPCYRKSDGAIGLYDLANGVFYTNQGTGTFLKGADVTTQIGGTTNPTIANPAPITNCGNGQIEVDVRGVNLFDIDNPFLVVENSYHLAFAPKIENGIIYGGGRLSLSDGAYLCVKTDGKSKYTFTYNVDFDETTETTRVHRFGLFSDVANGVASKYFLFKRVSGITKGKKTVTIDCQGYEYIGVTWYSNTRYGIEITELQIEKGDIATPYEPYFNSTASIPANVTLERDGTNETLLELAKIGDIADTITIDRIHNEVKYIQRICRVRPFENVGGTLEYGGSAGGNPDEWDFPLNKNAQVGIGKCEFSPITNDVGRENEFSVIIYDTLIMINTPKSLGLNSPEALESYLMQTGNSGLSIFYVLEKPIEWTITDEMKANGIDANLKTNLLEWAKNTKNQTNIIEITSAPSVSKTSVNYAKWGGVPNENNT